MFDHQPEMKRSPSYIFSCGKFHIVHNVEKDLNIKHIISEYTNPNNIMKHAIITINGKVQMVGLRTFIKDHADSLNINGFARNMPQGNVQVICEGEQSVIEHLIELIKEEHPAAARLDKVTVKYDTYKGQFTDFKRLGDDVLEESGETVSLLKSMLKVMQSFDSKAEQVNIHLNTIINKQDQTLDKLGTNTSILKEFKNESNDNFVGLKTILTDHDIDAHERVSFIKKEISEIKERLSTVESAVTAL